MALTLDDLGFEFDDSTLSSVDEEVQNGIIKPSSTIVDTPVLINDFLKDLVDGLKNLFESNLENLAGDFDSWFAQKIEDLKNEIESTLSLDPDTLYDIYVTRAQKAEDSDKFNGKTYAQMVSDLYTNYISSATVTNSIKFNNKTMDDYNDYIKNILKPHASDTDKAFGYDYDELKSTILSDVSSSSGGADLDTVKTKVENEWTAYKANDTIKFNGNDANTWINSIIPGIKVNNAVDSDKINGVSYDDLISSINSMISNYIEDVISSSNDDLINIIKNTKVNNAVNADSASNANKFDNNDADTWKNTIIPAIRVDNAAYADNSGKLGGLTSDEWQSKLDTMESDIESNVKNSWIAYKANEVLKINGIDVSDFDDHITQLIEDKLNDINSLEINATKFDDKTPDEWKTDIIPTIKVNNAVQADNADAATQASKAKLWCDETYTTCYTPYEYLNFIKTNFSNIVNNISDNLSDNFNFISSIENNYYIFRKFYIIKDTQLIFKENNNLMNENNAFDQSSFLKDFSRKEYTYDDDGNLTQIDYYLKYKVYDETDPDADPTIDEKLIKQDNFEYDDSNNLTKITSTSFFYIFNEDIITEDSIADDTKWSDVQYQKITEFTYTDGNISEENNTYKLRYKLASDDDDSWQEEEEI